MKKLYFLAMLMCVASCGYGQVNFPFKSEDKLSSVLAYWYNCKPDSVSMTIEGKKETEYLNSTLQIYGSVVSDSFYVNVDTYLSNHSLAYSNRFLVSKGNKPKGYEINIAGRFFKLTVPVKPLSDNPAKINVAISSSEVKFEKLITCKYHKLYGNMYDFKGNALKSFILIYPDGFGSDMVCGVWSDSKGYYQMDLPERVYNTFYVNDGNYKSTSLEAWSWHMIMDEDQKLDYKIGTGEVYNLNVWPNNGGFNTFFISFRPMVLHDPFADNKIELNNKDFKLIDISPDLDIKDFTVTINGNKTEIISLQKYYETGEKIAMPAYLIQLPRKRMSMGKQTIMVEYDKAIEKKGKTVFQNSMGYFQFFGNFFGYSAFN